MNTNTTLPEFVLYALEVESYVAPVKLVKRGEAVDAEIVTVPVAVYGIEDVFSDGNYDTVTAAEVTTYLAILHEI